MPGWRCAFNVICCIPEKNHWLLVMFYNQLQWRKRWWRIIVCIAYPAYTSLFDMLCAQAHWVESNRSFCARAHDILIRPIPVEVTKLAVY